MIRSGRSLPLCAVLLLLCFVQDRAVAIEPQPPSASSSSLDQALTQLTSDDETVRETALRTVIEQGDVGLIPRLDEIRANADRSVRQAIKPVMDLLKNRANLENPDQDVRRSAATDLGLSRRAVAIPWLERQPQQRANRPEQDVPPRRHPA